MSLRVSCGSALYAKLNRVDTCVNAMSMFFIYSYILGFSCNTIFLKHISYKGNIFPPPSKVTSTYLWYTIPKFNVRNILQSNRWFLFHEQFLVCGKVVYCCWWKLLKSRTIMKVRIYYNPSKGLTSACQSEGLDMYWKKMFFFTFQENMVLGVGRRYSFL